MRRISILTTILMLSIAHLCSAHDKPIAVTMSQTSTTPTAFLIENLPKVGCPNVSITLDASKADYILETRGGRFEDKGGRARFTLFDRLGKAVFATTTSNTKNAVKDICNHLKGTK
jgi:hypothetical protein